MVVLAFEDSWVTVPLRPGTPSMIASAATVFPVVLAKSTASASGPMLAKRSPIMWPLAVITSCDPLSIVANTRRARTASRKLSSVSLVPAGSNTPVRLVYEAPQLAQWLSWSLLNATW
jgi:hypothetical protein